MSLAEAVKAVLGNYAGFSGRARRSEYWFWALALLVAGIVVGIVDAAIGSPVLGYLLDLAVLVPSIAVGVRRLHDTGKSGWWLLIGLVPLAGAIVLLVFFVTDSYPGANEYGPSPKGAGEPTAGYGF